MPLADIFRKGKVKAPAEAVEKFIQAASRQAQGGKDAAKAKEDVVKYMGHLKVLLFGNGEDQKATLEDALAVATSGCEHGLLQTLVTSLQDFDFETKKDAAQVFGALVRMREGDSPGANYVLERPELLLQLADGYSTSELALNCGNMLRDATRQAVLAELMLRNGMFKKLATFIQNPSFEVSSDAFSTFKELLLRHPDVSGPYLAEQYDDFMSVYKDLLSSESYVTRRQALKLLGDLLGSPACAPFMVRFTNTPENLIQVMMQLRDESRHIQYEAFIVFRAFMVAYQTRHLRDPNTLAILLQNKAKLQSYISKFQLERDAEDETFAEEREAIVNMIEGLSVSDCKQAIKSENSRGGSGAADGSTPRLSASASASSIVARAFPRWPWDRASSKDNLPRHRPLPTTLYRKVDEDALPEHGHSLTYKDRTCDPRVQDCQVAMHVWEDSCTACKGHGTVIASMGTRRRRSWYACPTCHGLGYVRRISSRVDPEGHELEMSLLRPRQARIEKAPMKNLDASEIRRMFGASAMQSDLLQAALEGARAAERQQQEHVQAGVDSVSGDFSVSGDTFSASIDANGNEGNGSGPARSRGAERLTAYINRSRSHASTSTSNGSGAPSSNGAAHPQATMSVDELLLGSLDESGIEV
ncbi:unnamed protein product [Pedinophyceae sp. YPF-701]|nr:unnamed protein product [Pedinophyceae sp. YPF-701]